MTGEVGNAVARYNSTIVQPVWSIQAGQQYATIDALGEIAILDSGSITIKADYNGYSSTKTVQVVYQSNTTSQTTVDEDGTVTTETTTVTENPDGTITTTSSSTSITEDGFISQTESTTIANEDGSSTT